MTFDQPIVLTIAGFDPSGGAGVIADIKTLVHFGVQPLAAITSLTFQNSKGVFGAVHETAKSLRAQILPIVEENRIAAVKVGMLPTAEIVTELARIIRETDLPAPIIDPVITSSSGFELAESAAVEILRSTLLPVARLVTPNIPEAERLAGMSIESETDMREAALKLREMGARAVLIKGGHLKQRSEVSGQKSQPEAIDFLNDEDEITIFRGEWVEAEPVRGTGCMMSSAIAACLARGMALDESVRASKEFVAGVRSPTVREGRLED